QSKPVTRRYPPWTRGKFVQVYWLSTHRRSSRVCGEKVWSLKSRSLEYSHGNILTTGGHSGVAEGTSVNEADLSGNIEWKVCPRLRITKSDSAGRHIYHG